MREDEPLGIVPNLARVLASVSLLLIVAPSPAAAGTVSTVAGSGWSGITDGPVTRATFIMPFGIAVAPNGDIFVSDTGAQRIRRIRNGIVTTIAGGGTLAPSGLWVPGGFALSPHARFDQPIGIAAGKDGSVFVADSNNHVIDRIDRGGSVGVYAGSPGESGAVDGARTAARFKRPFALALDRYGNLYVADRGVGVRKIGADGIVQTLPIPIVDPSGLAISPGPNGSVFVAAPRGIYMLRFPARSDYTWYPNRESRAPAEPRTTADVGHPLMIAALNDWTVVYSDAYTGSLRRLDTYLGDVTVLSGDAGDDVENNVAGFRDGPASTALFTQPAGVAVDRDGSILVADAGNHRIRRISPISLRHAVYAEGVAVVPERDPKSDYRIAYVGNSFVFNKDWDSSIQRVVEQDLNAKHVVPGKKIGVVPVRVIAYQYDNDLKFIDEELNAGNTDAVVLHLNALQFDADGPGWQAAFKTRLAITGRRLAALKIPLVVVFQPMPYELTPSEWIGDFIEGVPGKGLDLAPAKYATRAKQLTQWVTGERNVAPFSTVRAPIARICAELGIPNIDLFPAFASEEKRPDHRPLFGTFDSHISSAGREFIGTHVAEALAAPPLMRYLNSSRAAGSPQ